MDETGITEKEVLEKKTSSKGKDKKNLRTFTVINEFITDLWEVFGNENEVSPLNLYHRFIGKVTIHDFIAIHKCIQGFIRFFDENHTHLSTNPLTIPVDTVIRYGDSPNVLVEIGKFLNESNDETKRLILQHILAIRATIDPSDMNLEELKKHMELSPFNMTELVDNDTKEGQFVNNMLNQAQSVLQNGDISDPMQMVMGLAQSGILQNMMTTFNNSEGNGLNPNNLMKVLKGALNKIIPDDEEKVVSKVEEVKEENK